MKFQIPSELLQEGQDRFQKYAEELVLRLKLQGIPLCFVDPANLKKELLPPDGLCLVQYRFRKKKGQLKTKWLTEKVPKRPNLDKCCQWNLIPVHIVPKKRGNPEQGLVFRHLLQEAWITSSGESRTRLCLIETDEKGCLLRRYAENQTSPNNPPLAFPRHHLAKINHVLASNFLERYWGGDAIPFWQFTKEGIAYYLGSRNIPLSQGAWHGMQQLLDSDAGDLAAILTAFQIFAVLKPFFPGFHRLDRHSPYLEGKKYFDQQFALSLYCADLRKASSLARLCCCINPDMPPDVPIIDGVRIYEASAQKQNREISFAEYEATVLQKASVLWVGRRPCEAVQKTGGILALELPATAVFPIQSALPPLLAQLTAHIHDRSIDDFQYFCTEVFIQAQPIVKQLLTKIQQAENQSGYYLEEDTLEDWKQEFQWQDSQLPPPNLFRAVQCLNSSITSDLDNSRMDVVPSALERIDRLQAECDRLCQLTMQEIKKIERKCRKRINNFCSEYQAACTSLEPYDTVTHNMCSHLAYLLASYGVFLRYCAPESQRAQRLAQLEQALIRACSNKPGLPVGEILERYLSALLTSGRCARLRGQGSGRADVCLWYDPKERTLLLPSKTYFDALCPLIPQEYTCTKRSWETKLARAGLLEAALRNGQLRRTFEVRTRKDDPRKISVLKVRLDALSQPFLKSKTVVQALHRMAEDSSPYRGVTV